MISKAKLSSKILHRLAKTKPVNLCNPNMEILAIS